MSKFVITKNGGIFAFQADDIVYMEKKKRKICLRTKCKKSALNEKNPEPCEECGLCSTEFYGRFSDVIPYLDRRFLYCHRSYIINMDHIIWMCGCEIFVDKNKKIYMGRDTYRKARKQFAKYINEKYPEKTLKNAKFFL